MSAPGGRYVVGLVGIGIVAIACWLVFKGISEKFTDELDAGAHRRDRRTPIVVVGKVGYAAKGVAFGIVGALFVTAAVQFEPKKSGGLDQALKTLLDQPFGAWLLIAVAVGLGCFGLYCFAWARHLRR